jgi:hypothetical protein
VTVLLLMMYYECFTAFWSALTLFISVHGDQERGDDIIVYHGDLMSQGTFLLRAQEYKAEECTTPLWPRNINVGGLHGN